MEEVDTRIAAMRRASPDAREAIKNELLALASGPDGATVRDAIETAKRGELLEIQWDLEEVLDATAPKKAEPPPKKVEEPPPDPNRPLTAKDLNLVYDDPRGIMLHKSKVGERWFLTQMDPNTGQPRTMELNPREIQQVQGQLAGSPYWVIGGNSAAPAAPPAPPPMRAPMGASKLPPRGR